MLFCVIKCYTIRVFLKLQHGLAFWLMRITHLFYIELPSLCIRNSPVTPSSRLHHPCGSPLPDNCSLVSSHSLEENIWVNIWPNVLVFMFLLLSPICVQLWGKLEMRAEGEVQRKKGSNWEEEKEWGHISFLQHIFHVLWSEEEMLKSNSREIQRAWMQLSISTLQTSSFKSTANCLNYPVIQPL